MTAIAWKTIETLDSRKLNEARRQAHNGIHWLARFANSLRAPESGNKHIELTWDQESGAFVTKPFADDYRVELRLPDLAMQFREGDKPVPHVLRFEDRTPAHVEAWALVELLHRGIERERFSKNLPYTPENLMTGDNEEFEPASYQSELEVLNGWYQNAGEILTLLAKQSPDATADEATIKCWPNSFQIGLEMPVQASGGRLLRAGMSISNTARPEPYFFVGSEEQADSGNFNANYILMARRIVSDAMTAEDVVAFLQKAIAAQRMPHAH
jgi:hypothetical protein